jgi:hypothetical protein
MASLHENGISFQNIHHFLFLNPLMLSKTSESYIFGVESHLPTSPQDMASKRAPDPPKMGKIHKNRANNQQNIQTIG